MGVLKNNRNFFAARKKSTEYLVVVCENIYVSKDIEIEFIKRKVIVHRCVYFL